MSPHEKVDKKNGIVVGYEPCYDRFNEINALFLLTLTALLKKSANYFEEISIPQNEYELMEGIRKTLLSGKQVKENLTKAQSIKDFSSGYSDIITSLTFNFETIEYKNDHGLFELIAGGLRGKKKDLEKLAKFIDILDRKLVEIGAIDPLSFCFAGRRL